MRLATVPYEHAYLDAVLPTDVVRIGPTSLAGGPCVPSPWLDPRYLQAHADEIDVLHLHTGYGHLTPAEMEDWTAAVRRTGIPLVVTVHHLRDPHQATRTRHDAHLAALMGTAEVVLTLTNGAADEIAERYGRTAIVVAAPALVTPVLGVAWEKCLVGIHLGSLPINLCDPVQIVRAALSGAVSGGGRLRVDVHPDVDLPELTALAHADGLELRKHGRFHSTELVTYLQELHVLVLPYRFGTHSRWLEACRDVGTRVVAPSCGYYADQWSDVVTYRNDEEAGFDPTSLTGAVIAALTRPPPPREDRAWRARQRVAVQALHAEVYARVASDRAHF